MEMNWSQREIEIIVQFQCTNHFYDIFHLIIVMSVVKRALIWPKERKSNHRHRKSNQLIENVLEAIGFSGADAL